MASSGAVPKARFPRCDTVSISMPIRLKSLWAGVTGISGCLEAFWKAASTIISAFSSPHSRTARLLELSTYVQDLCA